MFIQTPAAFSFPTGRGKITWDVASSEAERMKKLERWGGFQLYEYDENIFVLFPPCTGRAGFQANWHVPTNNFMIFVNVYLFMCYYTASQDPPDSAQQASSCSSQEKNCSKQIWRHLTWQSRPETRRLIWLFSIKMFKNVNVIDQSIALEEIYNSSFQSKVASQSVGP